MKPRIPNVDAAQEPAVPTFETAADSILHLEEALAAAPILKAIRWRLAESYFNRGDKMAAARTLSESPSWPDNIEMLEFAADVLVEAGHEVAEDVFEEILFQNPRHIDAHRKLAGLCRDSGREEDASEHEKAANAIRDSPLPERRGSIWTSPALRIRQRVQTALAKRTRLARANAISITIAFHLILILLFALWIVGGGDRPAELSVSVHSGSPEIAPDPSEQFVESVQQKPQQIPQQTPAREVSSPDPIPILIPEVDGPDLDDALASQFGAPLASFGNGSTGDSGGGDEAGGEVEFFGTRSHAKRVVFVVDFSSSMRKGQRLQRLKKELYRALASLPEGMLFNIIYYADSPWVGSLLTRSAQDRRLPSKIRWRVASKAAMRLTTGEIAGMAAGGSTYWAAPLRLALEMDPKPDLIWLLSDGDAADRRSLIKKIDHLLGEDVRINTIGLELGGEAFQSLVDIAKKTGGSYSIIMRGQQHDGEDALQFTNPIYGKPEN